MAADVRPGEVHCHRFFAALSSSMAESCEIVHASGTNLPTKEAAAATGGLSGLRTRAGVVSHCFADD